MSAPEPSSSSPHPESSVRVQLEDASFETDFADLAARFAAKSGGGLSPELSADLALEIVLNEIVEQACLVTGATGAAIVLQRDGEMVCRASSGVNAPQLGSRLDVESGLSGECIRTLRLQRCDDTETDTRVDSEASKRLGVRSLIVTPLLLESELVGVFELFSSQPSAFGERDELTLGALVSRTMSNLRRAAEPMEVHPQDLVPETTETAAEPPNENSTVEASGASSRRWNFDLVTTSLSLAILLCAVLLGLAVGRHFGFSRQAAGARPTSTAIVVPRAPDEKQANADPAISVAPAKNKQGRAAVPPGGLLVTQNGKEVFRLAPEGDRSARQTGPVQHASAVQSIETSSAQSQTSLLKRVEPVYPQDALEQKIQGTVVLQIEIGADGLVKNVQALRGPALLSNASIDAVKQWKFRAARRNGRPAESETTVTLNFRLPQ